MSLPIVLAAGMVAFGPATSAQAVTCSPTATTYTAGDDLYRVLTFDDTGSCDWIVPSGVARLDYLSVGGGGGGATQGPSACTMPMSSP